MSIRKVQLQWTADLRMNFPNYINKMSLNMWRLLSWTFSEPSLKCSWKSSRSEANYFSQHSLNLLLNFKISARFYILILTWTLSSSFLPPFRVPFPPGWWQGGRWPAGRCQWRGAHARQSKGFWEVAKATLLTESPDEVLLGQMDYRQHAATGQRWEAETHQECNKLVGFMMWWMHKSDQQSLN